MNNKIISFLLTALLSISFAKAQTCMRDSSVLVTGVLFSPATYTPDNPNYNLQPACINIPYEQSLTLNVPATITTSGITVLLTNISIATTNAFSGLPAGLGYACDPPNCVFNANTLGCILLMGTPNSSNLPDTSEISITAIISTPLGPAPVNLPNGLSTDEHYFLVLKSETDCAPPSAANDLNDLLPSFQIIPNPVQAQTTIEIQSLVSGNFHFAVCDLLGKEVFATDLLLQAGSNQFPFEAQGLAAGTYFYSLRNAMGSMVRQMVVLK